MFVREMDRDQERATRLERKNVNYESSAPVTHSVLLGENVSHSPIP